MPRPSPRKEMQVREYSNSPERRKAEEEDAKNTIKRKISDKMMNEIRHYVKDKAQ